MTVEQKINILEEKHRQLQIGLRPNEMCIREGIVIEIGEASRFGFEFFCFRSPFNMTEEMDCFVKYAKGKKCFLDVGAFDGIFSLVFAKMNEGSVVHAIEPSHEPNCRLLYNTTNQGNIFCHKVALTNYSGNIKMSHEWEHLVSDDSGSVLVECRKGDSLVTEYNLTPDVIKIDTEGNELFVLNGLDETITVNKPIIFLELHERVPEGDKQSIISMIKHWGYRVIDTLTDEEIEIDTNATSDKRLMLMP